MTTRTLSETQARARDVVRQSIVLIAVSTLILTVIGVVMVFSATSVTSISEAIATDNPSSRFAQAQRQLQFALAGLVLVPIAVAIPPALYRKASWALFGFGLLLQLLVLSPLQVSQGGNTNWIAIGGIIVQPSEFLKLAAILFVAVELGKLSTEQMSNVRAVMFPAGAGAVVATGAVLLGRDMGTAIVYLVVFVAGLWMAGIPAKWMAMVGLVGVTGVAMLVVLVPSRISRISDYIANLWSLPDLHDPTQSDHAMWAFGSGGFGGVGLGASREKWNYLPEAHNDFIFAVIGEELGLGGVLAIIILYGVLGYGLLRIVLVHQDRWVRYFTGMVGTWLVGQALLNMMVVTGVLPVFGVPLPFVSQGGSAMISCLLAIGVVLSLALRQEGVAASFRLNRASFKQTASVRSSR